MGKPYFFHKRRLGSKFGNEQKTYNGRTYHSKLEADYSAFLDMLKKGGELKLIEQQPRFRLTVEGHHICDIIPDFMVVTKDGQEQIHEVKSPASMTDVWRVKWKLMQALYPQFKYYVIKRGDF